MLIVNNSDPHKSKSGYRLIAHSADLGFRLYGESLADIFVNAAHALYGVMTDRRKIRGLECREVVVEAPDVGDLLVEWLNQLLYLFDATGFLGRDIEVQEITSQRLQARLRGEPLDEERHQLNTGIKAATYHNLEFKETADGWQAKIILDI
ncbi:MAG: hypothetical protein BZ151_02170 [Desulfobacca sp. 4484_104]|nr:MAG: hypothetical protein BZ151_02170 [Desulfobacca sp. 4484_104]